EKAYEYGPGGFHPVHIGDVYSTVASTGLPRYKVIAKLGRGGSATIWLASDLLLQSCVALKFNAARFTGRSQEISVMRRLLSTNPQASGTQSIIRLLDSFQVEGPNGIHEVLVTEVVLGYNVLRFSSRELPPAQKVAAELATGLEYIHSCDIVHGG
ncbi:kinase-like protein, partial [Sistotremastrum suecicum HHB10207 ss-3]